ncbi:hypothetical protein Bca52824_087892 [Brassica carinata]|uniref:F-box associated beta-propeller type 1 domain-containing protein n=1 Tax=Brassica carinata TaxID=52824 RepID=A0A8X7TNQ1_BRACI|nr:hypothetical protein Bca52824_087892 [Brassica carinata]
MRFNLSNINNNVESCVNPEAKLIGPDGSDQIDVREIFHCDGLLLCIPKDHSWLVVWNPYWGQTRWIECTHNYHLQPNHLVDKYTYALGHDSSSSSHKILRFSDFATMFVEFRIYEFSSDSWRILDLLPRVWMIGYGERGLTLKGNTYWFASEIQFKNSFLVCFDFTRETFWSHLPLPFEDAYPEDTIDEPNTVSWNNKVFLSADIRQLIHPQWQFPVSASFFIEEEKKIAVAFAKDTDIQNPTREVAYIIGVDGSIKAADSDRLNKVLEFASTVHLCAVLGLDFLTTITEVHPSLDGVQNKSISNETLSRLAETVLTPKEDKNQRRKKELAAQLADL